MDLWPRGPDRRDFGVILPRSVLHDRDYLPAIANHISFSPGYVFGDRKTGRCKANVGGRVCIRMPCAYHADISGDSAMLSVGALDPRLQTKTSVGWTILSHYRGDDCTLDCPEL